MKSVIVGTAGHIDHGKTALVKALTGVDADRLKEEKLRGITIDIGFADLALDDVRIGFVDVPGHERFVKNMLAGAHGLDMVMLVVSADESIMPQTREHFDICRLLNVKSGLIALTKSDLVDDELAEIARAEVEEYVRGSFLDSAPIVAVSSRTGAGIEMLKRTLGALASAVEPKTVEAVPRLPVDRSFSIKGFGTVVTGTLIAGSIAVGDEVEVMPAGRRVRVRNLQVHGVDTERALAGQRTAVNLQGISIDEAPRGAVLAPAGRLAASSLLDARLTLLPGAPRPLPDRSRVRLHHGTSEIMARVVILPDWPAAGPHTLDTQTGNEPARQSAGIGVPFNAIAIAPGQSRLVQLRLEQPTVALPGDRFIIRSYSPQVTIGGGVVIDPLPEKHKKHSGASAFLEVLEAAGRAGQMAVFIEMSGTRGMPISELAMRTGATDGQIAAGTRELCDSGKIVEVSGAVPIWIAARHLASLGTDLIKLVGEHHRREPLSPGPSREELRERLAPGLRPEVYKALVQDLARQGRILLERDTMRLPSHRPAIAGEGAAAKAQLEQAIKVTGLRAGTIEDAAASSGLSPEMARKLLNLLVSEKRVERLGELIFHSESLEGLKGTVRSQKAANPKIDVAVFKEITGGLSRKHAIPLLEYLDRERVTRRSGNEREIL